MQAYRPINVFFCFPSPEAFLIRYQDGTLLYFGDLNTLNFAHSLGVSSGLCRESIANMRLGVLQRVVMEGVMCKKIEDICKCAV